MANKDLLIEIGTEELPPKALQKLSAAFTNGVVDGLQSAGFELAEVASYATPRRLAVMVNAVADAQPDREVERKGPALKAAFDEDGNPTRAVMGFAKSCGVEVDQLQRQETLKGTWLVFKAVQQGKSIAALLPGIVDQSLARLPIPKRMRWGNNTAEFVRPVHWVVMLHGGDVVDAEILGIKSGNQTYGHRFHANHAIMLASAQDYADKLKSEGYVIADFESRQQNIKTQVEATAEKLGGVAVIDEALLCEVTALNEWPVAVAGEFEAQYLSVPAEALIKTMQDNQKYFPVVDGPTTTNHVVSSEAQLKNCFITISNIDSKSPEKVKAGNERVVRPRLADAKFFWEQDQKQSLESFAAALDKVVFQEKLGTIGDKCRRVEQLAVAMAPAVGANVDHAKRAAVLSKCDLMTNMVGEFAALQGVMGKRYAEVAGEHADVALALDEQYMPRGASDHTATSATGQCLAIADKLDTLVGIFAIGQKPTGEKDPFALRRAALGVLRTIIERQLDVDLNVLIAAAADTLQDKVDASNAATEVFAFMLDRLKAYYLDRNVSVDVFDAVSALQPSRPLDFDKRIKAVQAFRALAEAQSLAAANKRVGNILKKSADAVCVAVNEDLFEHDEEKALFAQLTTLKTQVEPLFELGEYESALCQLSVLREPVDAFFDAVMVMADDQSVRNNRIALLRSMSELFMHAADLSRLQS